ncbi:MAG: hypothetical protein INR73_04970 [Williamsia sp.]|nr:hypothetical protein [Williamsia sp.]
MNNFQLLEIGGVAIIIGFQLLIFTQTRLRIGVFKGIFPATEQFTVQRLLIRKAYFTLPPKDFFKSLNQYVEESRNVFNHPLDERVTLEVIMLQSGGNSITQKILYSLNTYLFRNREIAADFHLIKDVVERNCDGVEDGINQTISLPLYLGLLGTFLGIVFGLFQISGVDFTADPGALNEAISLLLGGVKIAMIASFTGLLLTVLNTGVFFKTAKAEAEDKKNDFYTFIQIELLPLLNQNINSTFFTLQNNLNRFNEEFKGNVSLLSGVMGRNHDVLIAQEKILTTLEKLDITEFAKANVIILHELQLAVDKFNEFNKNLSGVNEMVRLAGTYTGKLNEMIERTDNFHLLGQRVMQTFENNLQLQKFLQDHYSSLDESKQMIAKSVNKVTSILDDSLEQLKMFTQQRIAEVQKISLREFDLMRNEYQDKWRNLDHLIHLEAVNRNLSDLKYSTASSTNNLHADLQALQTTMQKVVAELETWRESRERTFGARVQSSFSKMLGRNKRNEIK